MDPHHVPPLTPRSRLATVGPTLALLATLACAGGCQSRTADPPVTVVPNVDGQGTRISSVLGGFYGPASWVQPTNQLSMDCPYPASYNVYTTGVTVTAVDTWDETGNGDVGTVYVQDTVSPTPIYAGMSLFNPGYTPPDLRPEPGDVLDVTGTYEEFIGPSSGYFAECETLPQIAGAAQLRFNGTVPQPVVITPEDLSTFEGARKYLSMLVTVQQPGGLVTVAAAGKESDGRYSAEMAVPSGSNWFVADELWDVAHKEPLSEGQQFQSITGIVTYFYDFELAPRSAADFVLPGGNGSPDAGADGG